MHSLSVALGFLILWALPASGHVPYFQGLLRNCGEENVLCACCDQDLETLHLPWSCLGEL